MKYKTIVLVFGPFTSMQNPYLIRTFKAELLLIQSRANAFI
jgi:hypothetical protein